MANAIVVVNAGSSSIKFSLFIEKGEDLALDVRGQIEGLYTSPRFVSKAPDGSVKAENTWADGAQFGHEQALDYLIHYLNSELVDDTLLGIGHRVVHGGLQYTQPVRVDKQVIKTLETFIPLAPLHQPNNLAPIRRVLKRAPQLPQVACFDTSFHRSNSEVAQLFALPMELRDSGVMRYGFHGLSYEYIAYVLQQYDQKAALGKTIVLHLGNGASMCAVEKGKSVASTMGFTAVEGLPMGTRSGSIDPGVILYLMDQKGMDIKAIETLLYKQSGLIGVSGISSDMRTLVKSNDPRAKLAIDIFVYRIRRALGSLTAALSGLDAIVFTAGIGENASEIRRRICSDAKWIGVELDEAANSKGGPRISTSESSVTAWVIPTNEELMIARHTRRLIQ
jgi:acetate kinase